MPELGSGAILDIGEPALSEPKLEAGELAPVRQDPDPEQVLALVGDREFCLELNMGLDVEHPLA